ncbi:MAG TPA: hypothetical protein VF842_04280 [Flavobacterium sp.]
MQILVKKKTAFFMGLFIANLCIAMASSFVLPAKFFYDAKTIVLHQYNEIGITGSYSAAILFYKITGLKFLPYFLVALIQYPILIYLLYKIGIPANFHKINVKNVLVYIGFFMIAIFMAMPSKEFITFIYLAIIPFVFHSARIPSKYKIIITLMIVAFFGVFFRFYFLLIPVIAIGMYFITLIDFQNRALSAVFYGLLMAIFISLSAGVIKGKYLSESSRDVVNRDRMNSKDANSIIISPIKTDTWYGETVGIVYGFFAVNIPLEGFKHIFSPQIIAFIIWQILLFYILFVRFSRCLTDRKKYRYLLWTLLILFSYFIVQGIFEPDLGTATRHKTGVFPLIYYALYYEYFRKELQQNI